MTTSREHDLIREIDTLTSAKTILVEALQRAQAWFCHNHCSGIDRGCDHMPLCQDMTSSLSSITDEMRCDKCGSDEGTGDELHTCPYGQDLYGDDRELCNCCVHCTNICSDDI